MPTVPHVLAAEVQGIDSRLLVVLTDTASLWVIGRDMAQVQLDAAGVQALREVLLDVAARMVEGGRLSGLSSRFSAQVSTDSETGL